MQQAEKTVHTNRTIQNERVARPTSRFAGFFFVFCNVVGFVLLLFVGMESGNLPHKRIVCLFNVPWLLNNLLLHLWHTQIIVYKYSELDPVKHALSLELFICMCSNELDFFRCSFSSSSTVHMLRLWIWSSSYMAFRADTVFRPALPGELASIHDEERPSEESSCDINRICINIVVNKLYRNESRQVQIINCNN